MQLKQIRTKKELSVPRLSLLSGVPIRTIENIERNDECKVSTAKKLAEALGVSMNELCE